MKQPTLKLIASIVLGSAVLGVHTAARAIDAYFFRADSEAPPVWSTCETLERQGKKVQFDANLNWFGANINIAPSASCALNQRAHYTRLETLCFDGFYYSRSTAGASGNGAEADQFMDCYAHGGGFASYWSATLDSP